MGKKEENTKILYNAFLENEKLSIADIMELLQINRKSAYNYLSNLETTGVKLSVGKQGKTSFYYLADKEDDIGKYKPVTKDVLRAFSVVKTLQEKPREHKELLALYELGVVIKNNRIYSGDVDFGYLEGTHCIDIKRTQFDKLIRELLKEEILVQPNKQGPLYPTGKLVPITVGYDEEHYWELCEALEKIPQGHPYYQELASAAKKLNALVGNTADEGKNYFYNYGRKLVRFDNIASIMEKLPLRQCSTYISEFTCRDKNGDNYAVYLATGMIVYSAEKDKLYIVGKKAKSSGKITNAYQILNTDNIDSVKITDIRHDMWQAKEFKSLHDAMFSISVDKPVKVKVVFENIFKIKNKVSQLLAQRTKAKISVQGDSIIYEDYLSGLDDFASYLRRFGRSCRVEEPIALKKAMAKNVKLSLERYEEAGYGK